MEQFYYLNPNNEQQGPVPASELPLHGVTASTLVWRQGLADWTPAGRLAELVPYFGPPTTLDNVHSGNLHSLSGQPQSQGGAQVKPFNWLIPSIIFTAALCNPVGIPAIIFATKVDPSYNSGDYEAAGRFAMLARTFAWICFGTGLLFWLVVLSS